MGLLSWLIGREKGQEEVLDVTETEQMGDLSLNDAISAHKKWTKRLDDYISGRIPEKINYLEVSPDNNCELGKWIHNRGRERYGHLKEWRELRDVHAQFHRCAGDVIRYFDDNRVDEAFEMFHGEFRQVSFNIQLSLAYLYRASLLHDRKK